MYVITFNKEVPQGFEKVMVTNLCEDMDDLLQMVTSRYMKTNFPELVLGDADYEMKRAMKSSFYHDTFVVDNYSCNDYSFTVTLASYL